MHILVAATRETRPRAKRVHKATIRADLFFAAESTNCFNSIVTDFEDLSAYWIRSVGVFLENNPTYFGNEFVVVR